MILFNKRINQNIMSFIDDKVGRHLSTGREFETKSLAKQLYNIKVLSAAEKKILIDIGKERSGDIRRDEYDRYNIETDRKKFKDYGKFSDNKKKHINAILEHWKNEKKVKASEVKKSSINTAKKKAAIRRVRPAPKFGPRGVERIDDSLSRQPYNPSRGGINPVGGTSSPPIKPSYQAPPRLLK